MKIKSPKVIFTEKDHGYWYGSGPKSKRKRMVSVTSYFGTFCEPFNAELWLTKNVLAEIFGKRKFYAMIGKHADYLQNEQAFQLFFEPIIGNPRYNFQLRREVLRMEWALAGANGTTLHEYLEEERYQQGYFTNPMTGTDHPIIRYDKNFDNQSIIDNLADLPDGAYPELLLWHGPALLAGQADMICIETIRGKRYVDTFDEKTNGGYKADAGKKRQDIRKAKPGSRLMKPPFDNLYDCTHIKYRGQLSLYLHLLEIHGFIPRNLAVQHYINFDVNQMELIPFEYMGATSAKLIDLRLSQLAPKTIEI